MKNSKARDFIHKFSIYIILVAMFIICAIVNDNFLSARNLINVARQLSVGTILAYGEMLLVIAGLLVLYWHSLVCFQSQHTSQPDHC